MWTGSGQSAVLSVISQLLREGEGGGAGWSEKETDGQRKRNMEADVPRGKGSQKERQTQRVIGTKCMS